MSGALAFVLAALALLPTPGPTNVLLAMSGATDGVVRSLRLIGAAVAGYLCSILILSLTLGPMITGAPAVAITLKALCAIYLVWLAAKLWREGSSALITDARVRFRNVFTATLLNPKAVILAFLIPALPERRVLDALPWLAGLCALVALVGLGWIALGGALRVGSGGRLASGWIRRVGASTLVLFAAFLGSSAWSSAAAMGAP